MEEQKIAKNRRHVILTLADGSVVEGDVFLSLYEAHGHGQQRVGETAERRGGLPSGKNHRGYRASECVQHYQSLHFVRSRAH